MINRRTFIGGGGALLLASAYPSLGQAQPRNQTGRLVFGLPTGSTGERLAKGLLGVLDSQFDTYYELDTVDSRNTLQAAERVKRANADGATLLHVQSAPMVLFPSMYRSLGYAPLTDFTPIAALGDYCYALVVGPAVPTQVKSVDQYLAWVRLNPDYRDLGFTLYGSQGHLITLMLARTKEVALRPQSYSSVNPLASDLKSASLAAGIVVAGSNGSLLDPAVRILAVSGKERMAALPNVATFVEQGVQDLDIGGWYGWFAPANLSSGAHQALVKKVSAAQATAQFSQLQKDLSLKPVSLTPAQIGERVAREMQEYKRLVSSYRLTQIV
ncbi:tripartite tricarboxylate transporter substrate-binding protein [Pseudomonas sp. nanlin1]|uniref:tripartite tricarboxylate transporter substrate-binding protein n=1 Tax=Pseudomonas sp. nanlin1 TaxID=3040605 RepID=UPI0038908F1A